MIPGLKTPSNTAVFPSLSKSRTGRSLVPLLKELNTDRNIILASGSPRRLELLKTLGFQNVIVSVSGYAENLDRNNFPSAAEYCLETALQKVSCVSKSLEDLVNNKTSKKSILIGADTIVEINGEVLEKPQSENDAYRMLSLLSNSVHLVHTGVTVFTNSDPSYASDQIIPLSPAVSFVQTTKVKFADLSDEDIWSYIESGEPFDKAGSYGIQGLGGQFVEHLEGCYFNVMGLPINSLSRHMTELYKCGKL